MTDIGRSYDGCVRALSIAVRRLMEATVQRQTMLSDEDEALTLLMQEKGSIGSALSEVRGVLEALTGLQTKLDTAIYRARDAVPPVDVDPAAEPVAAGAAIDIVPPGHAELARAADILIRDAVDGLAGLYGVDPAAEPEVLGKVALARAVLVSARESQGEDLGGLSPVDVLMHNRHQLNIRNRGEALSVAQDLGEDV